MFASLAFQFYIIFSLTEEKFTGNAIEDMARDVPPIMFG